MEINSRIRTRKVNARRASTRKHLKRLYEGMSGHSVNTGGYDPKFSPIYGEITEDGVEKLIAGFSEIQDISLYPLQQRTFYDLGSGIGKNVFIVASLVPEIKSIGIELVKDRHDLAMKAYNNIKNKSIKSRIEIINGSFFDKNVSDAAWVFISNLCFSDAVNSELVEKLAKELAPNSLIAFSKSMAFPPDSFIMIKQFNVPMTWDVNHQVYLYKKLNNPRPAVMLPNENYTFPAPPKVDLPIMPSPY